MTSSALTLFHVCLLLSSQYSASLNAPMNVTRQDSNLDLLNVSTELNVTTADTAHDQLDIAALMAAYYLFVYVINSLAGFGICGNLMNLFVWSAESAFNPTTFFIKVLSATDIVLLVNYFICVFLSWFTTVPSFFYLLTEYTISVCVHTTLAVVTTRWLAVYKPTQMKTLLTKRRVFVTYSLMLLWCFLSGLPYLIIVKYCTDYTIIMATIYTTVAVCNALPVVVLVCLNVSLVYKLRRHRNNFSLRQHNTRASVTHSSRFYRLLLAVVCLSVTTTVTYPVCGMIAVLIFKKTPEWCPVEYAMLGRVVAILLYIFNSSVNVVYYLLFVSHFRELLIQRFRCCLCRRRLASGLALQTITTPKERTDNP